MEKIARELRLLKTYSIILTLVSAALFVWLFLATRSHSFGEINVERINIVEADGKLRMVLSNKERQHPGVMDGITYEQRRGQRPPGMMFFNERGDELGGLVFDGGEGEGQGGSLTFDKFRGDQTIQFIHEEEPSGAYFSGLKMSDQNMPLNELINRQKEISALNGKEAQEAAWAGLREQGLLMTERLRIGKDFDKAAILKMKDAKGRIRIEMKVEANGNPKLSFLDESGRVVFSLPPASVRGGGP